MSYGIYKDRYVDTTSFLFQWVYDLAYDTYSTVTIVFDMGLQRDGNHQDHDVPSGAASRAL